MADYCTLVDVREEIVKLGVTAADDTAISNRIPRATAAINAHCRHSFDEATIVNETRRGNQVILTRGGDLQITVSKGFCQSVSALSVSHDLNTWFAIPVTYIDIDRYTITIPQGADNGALYRRSRLYAKVSYVGGYHVGAGELDLLKQVACRWTAFMYMRREAPFDRIVYANTGQMTIPSPMPADCVEDLEPFVRRRP